MPFLDLTTPTLTQRPGLQKWPQSEREWIYFIQELDSHFLGEKDVFTPTYTGFSSDPTGDFDYIIKNDAVFLFTPSSNGTSNSTEFDVTNLPTAITPTVDLLINIILVDGGVLGFSDVIVKSNSRLDFRFNGGSWTNSGDKGFGTAARRVIYYPLRIAG